MVCLVMTSSLFARVHTVWRSKSPGLDGRNPAGSAAADVRLPEPPEPPVCRSVQQLRGLATPQRSRTQHCHSLACGVRGWASHM